MILQREQKMSARAAELRTGKGRISLVASMILLVGLMTGCGGSTGPGPSDVVRSDKGPTEIVYTNGGTGELFVANGDGAGKHKLKLPANVGFDLAGFSLDGRFLARQDIDGGSNTWLGLQVSEANAAHSHLIWKFGDQFSAPTWNRSATMLAVTLEPNTDQEGAPACPCVPSGLWTVRPNGTGAHLVFATHDPTDGGMSPHSISQTAAWSPNGRRLAFVSGRHVETIAATGGAPSAIGRNPDPFSNWQNETLSWSANGRDVLVDDPDIATSPSGQLSYSQLDIFPVGGGRVERPLPPIAKGVYECATYSPDGKQIAYDYYPPTKPSKPSKTTATTTSPSVGGSVGSPQQIDVIAAGGTRPRTLLTYEGSNGCNILGWVLRSPDLS